jgi:hypothetical protein
MDPNEQAVIAGTKTNIPVMGISGADRLRVSSMTC